MRNIVLLAAIFFVPVTAGIATSLMVAPKTEREWQRENARRYKAETEVVLFDDARCDYVTDTEAIEIDWASKWAEAVGQATYYSIVLNKRPAIILLVKDKRAEMKFVYRCQAVCARYGIRLYVEFVKE